MHGASSEKEVNRTTQTPGQGQDGLVPLGCVSGHLCQDPRKGPPSPPRPHRGPSPAGGCQPQAALWPAGGGWEPLGYSHVSSPFYPVASDRTRSIILAVSRLPLPAPTSPPLTALPGSCLTPTPSLFPQRPQLSTLGPRGQPALRRTDSPASPELAPPSPQRLRPLHEKRLQAPARQPGVASPPTSCSRPRLRRSPVYRPQRANPCRPFGWGRDLV